MSTSLIRTPQRLCGCKIDSSVRMSLASIVTAAAPHRRSTLFYGELYRRTCRVRRLQVNIGQADSGLALLSLLSKPKTMSAGPGSQCEQQKNSLRRTKRKKGGI